MHFLRTLWHTIKQFGEIPIGQLSSALSFQVFFTLAPCIFLIVGIFGLIVDVGSFHSYILSTLQSYASPEVTSFFDSLVQGVSQREVTIPAILIGSGVVFLGVMGVTSSLMEIFRDIWNKHVDESISTLLKRSLFAYCMLIGMGGLLVGAMFAVTSLEIAIQYFNAYIPFAPVVVGYMNIVIIFTLLFAFFVFLFKYAPPRKIAWKHIIFPAFCTACALYGMRYVLMLYITYGGFSSVYGAASTLVIFLLWIQIQSYAIIFGAKMCEVSYVLAKKGK